MPRAGRTFVAVEVSPEIIARTTELIKLLSQTAAPVRWESPQQLHVTLKFLGEVDLLDSVEVCQAVARGVAKLAPFDYQVAGLGAFPSVDRPRTIWLSLAAPAGALQELHDTVDRALVDLGYRGDSRRFQPHLTIGRVKGTDYEASDELVQLLESQCDFVGGVGDVSEVVVFSSQLERSGPVYEELSRAELLGS